MSLKAIYPGEYLLWRDGDLWRHDEDYGYTKASFDYFAERLKPGQTLRITVADTGEVKDELTAPTVDATLKT